MVRPEFVFWLVGVVFLLSDLAFVVLLLVPVCLCSGVCVLCRLSCVNLSCCTAG